MTHLVEILLVEDNPDDEELTLLALNDVNLVNHVQVVRDGAEALDYLFAQGQYAHRSADASLTLILLDLKLPKVDGLEVLKRIKADSKLQRVPVVVLTSSREEQDIIKSYNLGANSYIVKPVDFEQFTQSVHQVGLYWAVLNQHPR